MMTTFEEWVTRVNDRSQPVFPASQREGQWLMNNLAWERMDLYETILMDAPEVDPFYLDEKIPMFYTWVGENW